MSTQSGNTLVADESLDELELNIETLQDLDFDASQVKGGGTSLVAVPATGGTRVSPSTSIITPSTSVYNPSGG